MKDSPILEPFLQTTTARSQPAGFSPRKVAEEFASLLLMEMMKSMRATLSSEGLDGEKTSSRDTYNALADTEVSRALAKYNGMGIADFLERPLNRMMNTIEVRETLSKAGEGEGS